MAYLKKKYFYRSIILVCLLFFFVSCGTFDYFKKSDGNNDHQTPEQIKIAQLESELSDSKENQVKLNDQIENKNTTIKKLKNNILKLEKIKTAKPVQYNIEYTHPSDL
ncbi:MAG: hypothetical protein GY699_03525, partial [Desulfobacteraceae bacterium]|nr:hypothetical protein [Desulfobacteraceae bacterium]